MKDLATSLLLWPEYTMIDATNRLNFQRKKEFMNEFLSVIRSSQLFSGISEQELIAMLSCLETRMSEKAVTSLLSVVIWIPSSL